MVNQADNAIEQGGEPALTMSTFEESCEHAPMSAVLD
jgi:hypothetical protein